MPLYYSFHASRLTLAIVGLILASNVRAQQSNPVFLLRDSLKDLRSGPLMPAVGPTTEYHFLDDAVADGPWSVTSFPYRTAAQIGWRVIRDADGPALTQLYQNT